MSVQYFTCSLCIFIWWFWCFTQLNIHSRSIACRRVCRLKRSHCAKDIVYRRRVVYCTCDTTNFIRRNTIPFSMTWWSGNEKKAAISVSEAMSLISAELSLWSLRLGPCELCASNAFWKTCWIYSRKMTLASAIRRPAILGTQVSIALSAADVGCTLSGKN